MRYPTSEQVLGKAAVADVWMTTQSQSGLPFSLAAKQELSLSGPPLQLGSHGTMLANVGWQAGS